MPVIKAEVQTAAGCPVKLVYRHEFTVSRINHGEVPVKDICVECGALPDNRVQQIAQASGPAGSWPTVPYQLKTAVNIPGQDLYEPLGANYGVIKR